LYLTAKTPELTNPFVNPPLDGLRIWAIAALLVLHTIVQNLPRHSAQLFDIIPFTPQPRRTSGNPMDEERS